MPGSSPTRTLADWFSVWRYRLENANFSTASKNFFHPGNVLFLGFIALIVGFGIQGSVMAGVLSASVLTAVAPWLLIVCSVLALISFALTIAWGIYRFWGDYREMYNQFEKLQEATLRQLEEAKNPIDNSAPQLTNAGIRASWNKQPGGPEFIQTLKYFGLDISNVNQFPDNAIKKGGIANIHDDSDDDDVGTPEHGPNSQLYIPYKVEQFLKYKQFSYWTYLKFLIHEWSTSILNRAEATIMLLLVLTAVILTACYFAGVASFMAPVFHSIIGFFDAAFVGLGMGGIALSQAHVAAMALAGIGFCLGAINLTATLERIGAIIYNFFDGFSAEPPAGFAVQDAQRRAGSAADNSTHMSHTQSSVGSFFPSASSSASPPVVGSTNNGNAPKNPFR